MKCRVCSKEKSSFQPYIDPKAGLIIDCCTDCFPSIKEGLKKLNQKKVQDEISNELNSFFGKLF